MKQMKSLMAKQINRKIVALAALAVLAVILVPLIRLTAYTAPWYDDYNYAAVPHNYWVQTGSFANVMKGVFYSVRSNWYAWQGTHASIFFMSLMPGIWGEEFYFLGPLLLIVMLVVACFVLTGVLATQVARLDKWDTLLLQALTSIVVVSLIHSAQEGIYWYNGGVHYVGMHSFLMLLIAGLVKLYYVQNKAALAGLVFWSMVGAAIAGGSNYVTSLQGILIVGGVTALVLIVNKRRAWLYVPALAVYIFSFYKNVSAPGNSVRQAQLAAAGQGMGAMEAVGQSFFAAGEYLFRFGGLFMAAVMVLLVPLMWNMAGRSAFAYRLPGLVSLASFCLFATGFTPSFYSLGYEGVGRTLNAVKITYQLLLLINEMYWIGWFRRKYKAQDRAVPLYWWYFPVMGALMLVIMFSSSDIPRNYSFFGAYYYMHSGEAQLFYQEYEERIRTLEESEESMVTVEPYHHTPWMLCPGDLSGDRYEGQNRAMAYWYGKEAIFCNIGQE